MAQLSPRKVSILAAFASAGVLAILLAIAGGLGHGLPLKVALPVLVAAFLASFAIIALALNRFIRSRIDLLYRSVHDLQREGTEAGRPATDMLARVEEEVSQWALKRRGQIEELEERERFRREFIGNLAHELKTPIFNIQGYILTLLEGGLEDERVNRNFLERASNGVDRLIKIVEDLDMIAKLESGIMDLQRSRMDLHELIDEIIDPMDAKAKEKGMHLRNAVEEPTLVHADRNRIAQVLTNLLNNALDYGRDGGSCVIRSYPLGERVVVEVADDGMGISPTHIQRVFERFYRVGKSRARNEGGSGLGLAIVKHIIEAHGQTITVKSTEGKGTTFSFTLEKR